MAKPNRTEKQWIGHLETQIKEALFAAHMSNRLMIITEPENEVIDLLTDKFKELQPSPE